MPVAASAMVDIRADANWADAQSAAAHWVDALDCGLPPVDLDDRDDHPHRGGPDDHPHQDGLDACPPSDLPAGTACCLAVSAC